MKMDLGVDVLPKFSKGYHRPQPYLPFAFTGNKFEFRMPGSAENLSDANTILNTAVAKSLKEFVAETSDAADFECAAAAWVKKTLNAHRRVIFNGNGYSDAWEQEAERRGLPNRKCTPDAMIALKDDKNIALMEEFGVLTKTEMLSRYEVEMEHYSKILNIEARTMLKIANKQLIPAATAYMGEVASSAAAKTAAVEGISTKAETKVLTRLSKYTDEMSDAADTPDRSHRQGQRHGRRGRQGTRLPRRGHSRYGCPACRRRRGREPGRRGLLAAALLLSYAVLYGVM